MTNPDPPLPVDPLPQGGKVPEVMRGRHTITVPEFAAMVGISRTVAYEAARRGEIPVRRIGHRFVVPVALALRWLGLAGEGQIAETAVIHNVVTPLREDVTEMTGRGF